MPREPLEQFAAAQAMVQARKRLDRISHTMVMEGQPVDEVDKQVLLDWTAGNILARGGAVLWSEDPCLIMKV